MKLLAKALVTATRAVSRTPSASPRASRMEMGARGSSPGGGLPLPSPTEAGSQAASEGGVAYEESQVLDAGDFEGQPCTSGCVHTHPLMLLVVHVMACRSA
eukprot:1690194-Heterocapsa_arctica.AAC.1